MEEDIPSAPANGARTADAEAAILSIVRDVLRRPVGPDADLFDSGATSLSFVRILAQVNQSFQVTVHAAELGDAATARSLAARVAIASSRPVHAAEEPA